jgi:hypothetical protein
LYIVTLQCCRKVADRLMVLRLRPHFYGVQALLAQPRAVRGYAGF